MKAKILVVDDNEQNLYLATFLLTTNGFEIVTAKDGKEALRQVVAERPDLILMDIELPEMDGYDVTRRVKVLSEFKDIPIIAVSSFAMVGDAEKAIVSGCSGYIEKPINPETFVAEVERFVRPTRSGGEQ